MRDPGCCREKSRSEILQRCTPKSIEHAAVFCNSILERPNPDEKPVVVEQIKALVGDEGTIRVRFEHRAH